MCKLLNSFNLMKILLIFSTILALGQGQQRRCFACHSRGKLGDCQDAFPFKNASQLVSGVEAVPCASGWCRKMIEGDPYGDDHDLATNRQCLQRVPSDATERCGEMTFRNKKVFACFCQGDLCNAAPRTSQGLPLLLALLVLSLFYQNF